MAFLLAWTVLVSPAFASERVDLFAPDGTRQGYAIVDRQAGRVDFYDVNSRRTGWGRMDASGRVERFDLGGQRQKPTVAPKLWDPPQ